MNTDDHTLAYGFRLIVATLAYLAAGGLAVATLFAAGVLPHCLAALVLGYLIHPDQSPIRF